MVKVYIASNRDDAELEKVIYDMDVYFLRIALYGIARGDNVDDAILLAEHAAQQSTKADGAKTKTLRKGTNRTITELRKARVVAGKPPRR
jgi:hypothetical protein